MAKHRGGRASARGFVLVVCVAVAVAACRDPDEAASVRAGALTAAGPSVAPVRTAEAEQARATAYSNRAESYRQLSNENKRAVAALAGDAVSARADRQSAAALADSLAAAAQKIADFHARKPAEMTAAASAGVRP